mgnify:CR=1 FL=1
MNCLAIKNVCFNLSLRAMRSLRENFKQVSLVSKVLITPVPPCLCRNLDIIRPHLRCLFCNALYTRCFRIWLPLGYSYGILVFAQTLTHMVIYISFHWNFGYCTDASASGYNSVIPTEFLFLYSSSSLGLGHCYGVYGI